MKRIIKEDEIMTIIETYRVPVGNSSAGEMAAEWTMDALQDIRKEIQSVIANSPQVPEGYTLVPIEPPIEIINTARAFALSVSLSHSYSWSDYMRDLYGLMLSAKDK